MGNRNTCRACEMLKQGVKFRVAPKHTCGQYPASIIKIPKVDPAKSFEILINRTGIIETPKALVVTCKKQIIEGVTIPSGYEIIVPNATLLSVDFGFSSSPRIDIPGWKLNAILRTLYLDSLRNENKS